jgi:hypothetical protein
MRFSALAAGVLALALSACATLDQVIGGDGSNRFDAGLAALRAGDYIAAHENLAWVAENKPGETEGRQALLIISAMEMDPRNPMRRLSVGSDLVVSYMNHPDKDRWTDPIAQTMYLLAVELGGAEDKVAQAEAEKREAERQAEEVQNVLPRLPQASATVPARIKAVSDERDRLAKKVDQLEAAVAERDKKLAEKEKELERIKKTLKG